LGVQWHAEVDAHTNPINRALFRGFGAALRQGNRPRRRASETV
jgi:gamma-glutamyl-gamma-aminobutyrate hydrolase PuuD